MMVNDDEKKISQEDLVLLINYLLKNENLKLKEIPEIISIADRTIHSKLNGQYVQDPITKQYILKNSGEVDIPLKPKDPLTNKDVFTNVHTNIDTDARLKNVENQLSNVENQFSNIFEQLTILSQKVDLNNIQPRIIDNNVPELSYLDFIIRDSKNFHKQSVYIYLPLYDCAKVILKKRSRLFNDFFNQSFFKLILEDYIQIQKSKDIDFLFNKENFNDYLMNLLDPYKL